MPIETEIKFTVPDKSILDRVAQIDSIAGYTTVNKGVKLHTDTYFDTQDFQLFRGKFVLRLRRWENQSVLTFKASSPPSGSSQDGIHRRREIEHGTDASAEDIVQGRLPDHPPLKALYKAVGRVNLSPSLTVNNRRRIILLTKGEAPYYEMVLDDVIFSGPGGEKGVYELEVEAIAGNDENLRDIGKWLAERFDFTPAGPSKYILGMQLVGGLPPNYL